MTCIHFAEIDEIWPRIASVVCEMMEAPEVERMLGACRSGSALVLASEDAVAIVTLRMPEDRLELLIWAAVGRGTSLVERYLPFFEHLAREVGAHRITFQPRRRGWSRRLRRLGDTWRLRDDGMFVMEVR